VHRRVFQQQSYPKSEYCGATGICFDAMR